MTLKSKTIHCSIPVFLVVLGISAFGVLATLGIIYVTNYGISNPTAWILIILGISVLILSIFFSTRIQLMQSHRNRKTNERIKKREKQRRRERKRAKKMIHEKGIFYINIPNSLPNTETQSLPPRYEDVIKFT